MKGNSIRAALAVLLVANGCTPAGDAPAPHDAQSLAAEEASVVGLAAADEARALADLEAHLTGLEDAARRLPGLIGSVRVDMRRHLNAAHVNAARRAGVGPVRDSAHVASLLRSGALVELPDSSRWWVLRELDQSLPYVTPATKEVLEEIGRRFHTRLEERGLPPFRLDVTSVLRTGEQQAALRRRNSNASRTTSSHEFGTTVDVAYLSFAAPQSIPHSPAPPLDPRLHVSAIERLDTLGTRYAPHLEGELGAVLQEMQREGILMTLRERSQPVYHTTALR